jgi:hypothetical protein
MDDPINTKLESKLEARCRPRPRPTIWQWRSSNCIYNLYRNEHLYRCWTTALSPRAWTRITCRRPMSLIRGAVALSRHARRDSWPPRRGTLGLSCLRHRRRSRSKQRAACSWRPPNPRLCLSRSAGRSSPTTTLPSLSARCTPSTSRAKSPSGCSVRDRHGVDPTRHRRWWRRTMGS